MDVVACYFGLETKCQSLTHLQKDNSVAGKLAFRGFLWHFTHGDLVRRIFLLLWSQREWILAPLLLVSEYNTYIHT